MKKIIIFTCLCILLFVFVAIYRLNPPSIGLINAPQIEFSSGRAMKYLEVIAQKPHPIGAKEHTNVRDYIVKKLETMGLSPEVQTTTAVNSRWGVPYIAGTVNNVIARLKGTNSTKAILVAAHYDSITQGPGASDDGAAVAGMLETVRALKAGSPLKNDVIFLFTDGEEDGLLGAKAFVDEHPWAKDVGLAMNFEARGNSGSSVMFETSDRNQWVIQEFAKAAVHPVANSLFYSIYKILPNDTDFTIFKQAGFPGLNFAYINGVVYYHTLYDNIKNIDERSVQHQGEQALALVHHFGNINLEQKPKSDAVYFDILGLSIIHYSAEWCVALAVFIVILFVGVAVLGFRNKQLKLSGIILGFFALLLSAISSYAIVTLAWLGIATLHSGYAAIPQRDTYNSNIYAIAFTALTVAIVSGIYVLFHKKVLVQNLAVGALVWWLILVVLTSLYLPGVSYLFALPLLFSLLGLGFAFATNNQNSSFSKRFSVLTACAIPGIILVAPTIYLILVALTLEMSGVAMVLLVLLLGLLVPHLCLMANLSKQKLFLPATAILVSLSFIVAGSFTGGFDAQHPKPNNLFYGLNANTGKAIWASADKKTDEWTSQFLSGKIEKGALGEYLPLATRQFLHGEAPVATLAAPNIEKLSDEVRDGVRSLRLRISSPRQARILRVYLDSKTEVIAAAINGKKIDSDAKNTPNSGKGWGFHYFALGKEGVELNLAVKPSQSLKLRSVDQSDGFPQIAGKSFAARPNYMMPTGFASGIGDSTLVSKSFIF